VQDKLKLTLSFDKIQGYKYLAYSVVAIDTNGRKGHKWPIISDFECDVNNGGILNETFSSINCFDEIHKIAFETGNHDLNKLDSIIVRLCKISDLTGDFTHNSKLSRASSDPYLSALAPDDNVSSNVTGGYGAVLTISCTEEIYIIK
jgi:hypothetical protein